MDKYGCVSSGVWNILLEILLHDVVLSVYYCYYLQMGLCSVVDY